MLIKNHTPLNGEPEMPRLKMPKPSQNRDIPMSFKTFPHIKKKLIKLAQLGDRSISRQMEVLIREAPFKKADL